MRNVAQKSEKSIAGAIKINEKEIVDGIYLKFWELQRAVEKIKNPGITFSDT